MYGGGSAYNGASQFAGGGFMSSQGGADNGVSPTQGAKGGGRAKSESLTPLTVRQLHLALEASMEDSFTVDGEEVNNLTLVGKIVSSQASSTSMQYTLDDSTGKVPVRFWLDQSSGADKTTEWKVGTYVRVYGHLRQFQGQRSVVAFTLRPVTDFNEVTYHMLETIFVHQHRLSGQGVAPTVTNNAPAAAPYDSGSAYQMPPSNTAGDYQAGGMGGGRGGGGAGDDNGMDPCQNQVMSIYNSSIAHQTDAGLSVDQVVQELGAKFDAGQIRQAVEFLINEGHLYSTIDDNHFKSTSC